MAPKPHIIVLTEVWAHSHEASLYSIQNYKMFFKCGDDYHSSGGFISITSSTVSSSKECNEINTVMCYVLVVN